MSRIDPSVSKLLLIIVVGSFIVGLGLAGLGVYIVYIGGIGETEATLLGQSIKSKNTGVAAIFIGALVIIFLVRPAYRIFSEISGAHDDIFSILNRFKQGTGNPTENVALLETIANSNNSQKRDFLSQALQIPSISFMEVDAINLCLSDLESGGKPRNLLKRCREVEIKKIDAMVPETDDPRYKPMVTSFKYARYISRKDSPTYGKLNEFLSECLVHRRFTDRALILSRELENDLRIATESGNSESSFLGVAPSNKETFKDKSIRLEKSKNYSAALAEGNKALLIDQNLAFDPDFACAHARCLAALGNIDDALVVLFGLSTKHPDIQSTAEYKSTSRFLADKGLSSDHVTRLTERLIRIKNEKKSN